MPMLLRIVLIALGAGVIGTLVGGLLGIAIRKPSKAYVSLMLSFAAGAMIGVSLFELLPESFDAGGIWAVLGGTTLGAIFVYVINLLNKGKHEDEKEETSKDEITMGDKRKLRRMGITIFIAMALHSLPEGLAIGAGEHLGIGLLLGVVFFLHFVPEGLAIAVPMKAGGTKIWKILLLCVVAGLPAVIGGIAAYYIGKVDVLLSYSLSFAAGAMLYVALSEMLPTAYKYSERYKLISVITLVGAFLIVIFSVVI